MSKTSFEAPMELKPGVSGAELEKFWVEEYLPNIADLPGYRVTLNKGIFGARNERYMYIGHFDSVERLNELFPTMGDATGSEEWQRWSAQPAWQKLMSFFDESWYGEFTQYLEL